MATAIIKLDAHSLYLLTRNHLFRTVPAYPGYIEGVNEPISAFQKGDKVKLQNIKHGFLGVVDHCIGVASIDGKTVETWYSHGLYQDKKSEEVIRFAGDKANPNPDVEAIQKYKAMMGW